MTVTCCRLSQVTSAVARQFACMSQDSPAADCDTAWQDDDMDDDSASEREPEEGSVADSDAEEHEYEETACTSSSPLTAPR